MLVRTTFWVLLLLLLVFAPARSVAAQSVTLNLKNFGAAGDGVTDDSPALQAALAALAAGGGGCLFVPAGHYVIASPVAADFGGTMSITIFGVQSSTPVDNAGDGSVLSQGLDLTSEFLPQTGETQIALSLTGLQSLLVHDLAFLGTPEVDTDACVSLNLDRIQTATIRHCEFYGLSTLVEGGAIVRSMRSILSLEQSKFLGCTANSGVYTPVVDNVEWKGLSVTNCTFVDYGQRPELYGKMGNGSPMSWINIGNAGEVSNNSPRREVAIRDVFLDEGGFLGISVMPNFYQPALAPVDLFYVSGLRMNVSNFGSAGNYVTATRAVLIEDSHYGWSHYSDGAVVIASVQRAILDRLECTDGASRIRADSATGHLSVINSVYESLDSQAQITDVINTAMPEADPVQYVRQQYEAVLGREPDAAGHYYWSELVLNCGSDANCVGNRQALLQSYLHSSPTANFAVSGRVTDDQGAPLSGVPVTLGGSQTVATQTDANGHYSFSNLPTSGVYTLSPSANFTFESPVITIATPAGDQTVDFAANVNRFSIGGQITGADGSGIAGANVTLSGSQSASTNSDAAGNYSFAGLPAGGVYSVAVTLANYSFSPASLSVSDLQTNQTANFTGTVASYQISGRITENGLPLPNATVTLSGAQGISTTTGTDGGYSFSVPAEQSYAITPSEFNHSFTPASVVVSNLSTNQSADFTAQLNFGVPVLISQTNSTRALALDSVLRTTEPFDLAYEYPWSADNRTRLLIYATNFDLLPNENATAITADVQDATGHIYNLTVEYVDRPPELSWLNRLIVRLPDDLGDAGDVLLRINYHGIASNRVRVAIGHMGGGPPDDLNAVPTPGVSH